MPPWPQWHCSFVPTLLRLRGAGEAEEAVEGEEKDEEVEVAVKVCSRLCNVLSIIHGAGTNVRPRLTSA